MVRRQDPGYDSSDSLRPCSREPAELCDGATITWAEDGTSRREPMLTPRTFCEPCRSRIITCLEELPPAYGRLAAALGDAPRTGKAIRAPFGPGEPVRAEVDALMRVTAVILHGWEARVRRSRLQLAVRGTPDILDPASVMKAAETIGLNIDVFLALQPGWMTRTFTFPPGKPGAIPGQEGTCRRCGHRVARLLAPGRRNRWYVTDAAGPVPACAHEPRDITSSRTLSLIPAEIEAEIGDEEIVVIGDGWLKVTRHLGAARGGNEIIERHYRARRILGETKAPPESFDGIPCRSCDELALERAEPPSDPTVEAMHSRCALCKDEMDRDEFAQWADMYASWARGAGVQVCRRCSLAETAADPEKRAARHAECCWHACSCTEAAHPRRRVAA